MARSGVAGARTDTVTAESAGDEIPGPTPPAFGPTLALTVALALGAAGMVMGAVMLLVEPQPVPLGFEHTQRQEAETAVYAATFLLVLPVALLTGPRLARGVRAAQGERGLRVLSALLVAGLALVVLVTRASWHVGGGGMGTLLALTGGWALAAGAALGRARTRPWPLLARAAAALPQLPASALLLVAATPWTVARLSSLSPVPLLIGAVATAGLVALAWRGRRLRRPGRAVQALDLVAVALIALATVDLVVLRPEAPVGVGGDPYINWTTQFHANFLLGPTNHVLHGGAMLVDTASQYGVASIYFLAGWFQFVPLGYGTFGLLDGLLSALWFIAGYAILRMAGCSPLLAGGALAVAVAALVLARPYPVGTLLQEGPLRFGLPMLVVLAAVAATRWPQRRGIGQLLALAVVGISSIWAVEAFALTLVTFASLVGVEAVLAPPGERRRLLRNRTAGAAAACVCAHAALTLGTLAFAGSPPDWGQYLAYLREFFFGELGDLTYDFSAWSPGLAVGAAYLASAAAIALLLLRSHRVVRRERATLVALMGTTAYGTALLMYLVDRSLDHVVAYVSLPALLACVLWLGLLLRCEGVSRELRIGALALSLSVSVLLVSVAWSEITGRIEQTALAHVVPGGDSPRAALARLRDFPPLHAGTPAGERLLRRHLPGERSSLVVVTPELRTELLLRTRRSDRLGLAYPLGDSFVSDERLPGVRAAVAQLRGNERMLVNVEALGAVQASGRAPLGEPASIRRSAALAPLQLVAMRGITRRFRLVPVHRGPRGYLVVRLMPRG